MTDPIHLEHGPYLATAVFCEKPLRESDGVLSIIRIIDRITISAGSQAPEEMPSQTLHLTAVLSLKSGFLKGKYTVNIKPVTPSGVDSGAVSMPVLFEGDDRGTNLILNFAIPIKEEGLYWFDVLIEQQLLTRMPLRILYQRLGAGMSQRMSSRE